MQVTAKIISDLLQGTIEGDPNVVVSQPAKIEEGKPGTITFLANKKYESYAYTTKASILLVSHDFKPKQPISATLIRVKDVYAAITFLLEQFNQQQNPKPQGNVDSLAFVGNNAKIGEDVTIGAFAYISNTAEIGNNVIIHPHAFVGEGVSIGDNTIVQVGVKILKDCKVGNNCIIHPNAVIGSDGFGYRPQKDGSYKKVPQLGNVVIGNEVEIGTNTVIDRAVMGSTVIKDGVKLDNLIQVAHNVEIGKNTAIAAQAGVAGSAVIGENCIVGGQAGIVGHIKVADGSKIQAQSGVATSIKEANKAWYGSPAFAYSGFLRSQVWFQKLPQLEKRIRMLEKQLKEQK